MPITPEGRNKLSELARSRHAENGGGFPDGRRPGDGTPGPGRPKGSVGRKKRISARVAEAAAEEENAKAIVNVFKDAIHPSQPMQVRLKGAEAWAKIAQDHDKFELSQEAADQTQRSREELLEILTERLSHGPAATIIRKQIEENAGVVDAEVVDDE